MALRRVRSRRVPCAGLACLLALLAHTALTAAGHTGVVTVASIPLPGATVTATQGDRSVTTRTDANGVFDLADLEEGTWTIRVEMPGFRPLARELAVAADTSPSAWDLEALPVRNLTDAIRLAPDAPYGENRAPLRPAAGGQAAKASARAADLGGLDLAAARATLADTLLVDPLEAADGLLVHGSINNSAATPFAQARAFGNNRPPTPWPYNLTFGTLMGRSGWDARPHALFGERPPRPDYGDIHVLTSFGGPIRIGGFRPRASFFLGYQRTADHTASTQSALLPTTRERAGDFSHTRDVRGVPVEIRDPETGLPFPNNTIPADRVSPQAAALLGLYPQPAAGDAERLNHHVPIVAERYQHNIQSRVTYTITPRVPIEVSVNYERGAADRTTIFGFPDASRSSGLTSQTSWSGRLSRQLSMRASYNFTRRTNRTEPAFAFVRNVSGEAGITGNNQDPAYWGPPTLRFASGIAGLTDAAYALDRTRTHVWSTQATYTSRGRHALTFGADVRRQALDVDAQQDARGTFTFTGAATGHDFADFLLGLPQASAIAFGNPDKAYRGGSVDLYVADDWRIRAGLTANIGVRWEYESPVTEGFGRLVNLDIAPGFTAVAPVLASDPIGHITGRRYPASLVRPDPRGFQPRLGLAWRPRVASSLVLRAGYGLYRDTNIYQSIATQMAQQPPLSTTASLASDEETPLTLAHGFPIAPGVVHNTFAVDPDFRASLAHNWQISGQRDLPFHFLSVMVTYSGVKGTRLMQQFLPNTYPAGAVNPCPSCPSGFVYLTANGRSRRDALQLQLRRRLSNGFTATVDYTLAKATDNATSFGGAGGGIAQNWQDLAAEHAPSSFDQRHLVSVQAQYTTGTRVFGGGPLDGRLGALVRNWTFSGQLSTGSGLPLTPVHLAPVRGTGIAGPIRASLTGEPVGDIPPGYYLNPAAYAPPASGEWGTAGRHSVTGPRTFSLDAAVARSFRLHDRKTLEWRLDATNVLNRTTYAGVTMLVTSPQFGLPTQTGTGRRIRATFRVRL